MSIETQIPIFRAKKIDSDEYVVGFYSDTFFMCMGDDIGHYIYFKKLNINNKEYTATIEIDPSTLAIHLPDMIDSQGNAIFASLSENGKGGDITQPASGSNCELYRNTAKYSDKSFSYSYSDLKIVWIQR